MINDFHKILQFLISSPVSAYVSLLSTKYNSSVHVGGTFAKPVCIALFRARAARLLGRTLRVAQTQIYAGLGIGASSHNLTYGAGGTSSLNPTTSAFGRPPSDPLWCGRPLWMTP